MTSYKTLKKIFHDAALSSDIAGILHWDMSTMMPKNSRENRAEQLAYLAKIRHQLDECRRALRRDCLIRRDRRRSRLSPRASLWADGEADVSRS